MTKTIFALKNCLTGLTDASKHKYYCGMTNELVVTQNRSKGYWLLLKGAMNNAKAYYYFFAIHQRQTIFPLLLINDNLFKQTLRRMQILRYLMLSNKIAQKPPTNLIINYLQPIFYIKVLVKLFKS